MKSQTLKHLLLKAPDNHLAESLKPMIRTWPEGREPDPIQILELLDQCVGEGGTEFISRFTLHYLKKAYVIRCAEEGTSHERCVEQATWRFKKQ